MAQFTLTLIGTCFDLEAKRHLPDQRDPCPVPTRACCSLPKRSSIRPRSPLCPWSWPRKLGVALRHNEPYILHAAGAILGGIESVPAWTAWFAIPVTLPFSLYAASLQGSKLYAMIPNHIWFFEVLHVALNTHCQVSQLSQSYGILQSYNLLE